MQKRVQTIGAGTVDAAILLGLGFGVRAGLHLARWLFAVYAFVTPILVIASGGGNAVIWPFIFFYVCRSLISRRNGSSVEDPHALQTEMQLDENASMTYHLQDGAPPSDIVPPTSGHQASVDEDRIYARIAEELETGNADKGLWTRLFAECGGDEKQTKVLYIKQRAEWLIALEQGRLAEIKGQRDSEAARLEKIVEKIALVGSTLREQLSASNITMELAEKLRKLSDTHSSVIFMNKVRRNLLYDVEVHIAENPFIIAVVDSDGNSPLHVAIEEKHIKMVQLLLEKGAPTDIKNLNGDTPLNLSRKTGNRELIVLMEAVSAS